MIFIFIYCEDNQSESNLKNNNQTGNDNISIENEMNHQSDQSNNDKTQETDIDNTNQMENDKSKIEINDFEKTNPENLIKVDYDNKKYKRSQNTYVKDYKQRRECFFFNKFKDVFRPEKNYGKHNKFIN